MWRYLSEYATVASLPKDDMFQLERLLTDARETHVEWRRRQRWVGAWGVPLRLLLLLLLGHKVWSAEFFPPFKKEIPIYSVDMNSGIRLIE